MQCPECGKKLYIESSNCFYCGAVLGLEEVDKEKPAKKSGDILNTVETVFDRPAVHTMEDREPYKGAPRREESAPSPFVKQEAEAHSSEKIVPPSIDSYYKYTGKPPTPPKSQADYIPPISLYVKETMSEDAAIREEARRNEESKRYENDGRRKKVVLAIIAALVVMVTIAIISTIEKADRKKKEDNIAAFYSATKILKSEMKSQGWSIEIDDSNAEDAKRMSGKITNNTGVSYRDIELLTALYDRDENIIATGKMGYEIFEKGTTLNVFLDLFFSTDYQNEKNISSGNILRFVGILGEPYDFESDAPGMELEVEPILEHDTSYDESNVDYVVRMTNKTLKPTSAMILITPINYRDYEGYFTQERTMIKVLVPPLESGESFEETVEGLFRVYRYSDEDETLEEYLTVNEYAVGDTAVYMIDEEQMRSTMKEPYMALNIMPIVNSNYSHIKWISQYNDKKSFYLSVDNKFVEDFYSVSAKISFYDRRLNKLETITVSLGDIEFEGGFDKNYIFDSVLADGYNAAEIEYYAIEEIYGFYFEEKASDEDTSNTAETPLDVEVIEIGEVMRFSR